jgi:hypothetical protein
MVGVIVRQSEGIEGQRRVVLTQKLTRADENVQPCVIVRHALKREADVNSDRLLRRENGLAKRPRALGLLIPRRGCAQARRSGWLAKLSGQPRRQGAAADGGSVPPESGTAGLARASVRAQVAQLHCCASLAAGAGPAGGVLRACTPRCSVRPPANPPSEREAATGRGCVMAFESRGEHPTVTEGSTPRSPRGAPHGHRGEHPTVTEGYPATSRAGAEKLFSSAIGR